MRVFRLSAAAALAACTADPEMTVSPPGDLTEPTSIAVTGLAPGTEVRLTVERPTFWVPDRLSRSVATFRADGSGRIDTTTQAPVAGSYGETDPFGVFWSQERTEEPVSEAMSVGDVRVAADLDADGQDDLEQVVRLPGGTASVVEEPLGDDFPGAFVIRPAGTEGQRLPVVVALGGSSGGDGGARSVASRIASMGFAVAGVPYYSPAWFGRAAQFPTLPEDFVELPVDYVERTVSALRERDDVDPDRVALYGVSKGGELALLLASLAPDDAPGGGYCSVAAIVPSDVVWEGWGDAAAEEGSSGFSWRGEPLPFVPYQDIEAAFASRGSSDPIALRVPHDEGRAANPDRVARARIAVEAIDEPVLVLGGDADRTWDSGGMSRAIAATREAAGLETVALTYPDAGHGLGGTGYDVADRADALAQRDAWPRTAAFLTRTLTEGGCPNPRR